MTLQARRTAVNQAPAVREKRVGREALTAGCAATLIAGAYLAAVAVIGWVPHDEGTLAQSAHRVLRGEVPHRDYTELYTGGLTFLHAAAFRVLGESLLSLRYVVLAVMVLTIPLIYFIALRFVRPWSAALSAIAAVAWSFPNYPASMPSWYNLSCALLGCAALLAYLETERLVWVFVAGLAAGISVLFKIVGLYSLAATALSVLYLAYSSPGNEASEPTRYQALWRRTLGVLSSVLALAPLFLLWRGMTPYVACVLAVPVVASSLTVTAVVQTASDGAIPKPNVTLRLAGMLAGGALLPIGVFTLLYWHWGALSDLWNGVFVLPLGRIEFGAQSGPTLYSVVLSVPLLYVLMSSRYSCEQTSSAKTYGVFLCLLGFGLSALLSPEIFRFLWTSARMTFAPVAIAGLALVAATHREKRPMAHPEIRRVTVVLLFASWVALIQFPFSAPIYFAYTAPFALLAAIGLVSARNLLAPRLRLMLLLAVTLLGIASRRLFFAGDLPTVVVEGSTMSTLSPPRGGLRVRPADSVLYARLNDVVNQHSTTGTILAGPDAPQIYFMTNRENPTRMLFESFEDSESRVAQIRQALSTGDVQLAVVNTRPRFSGPLPTGLRAELERAFRNSASIGAFTIRW